MLFFHVIILSSVFSMSYSNIQSTKDGYCTSIEEKDQLESEIVTYLEIETFVGRCPGYYFRKCLQSRSSIKSRVHYDVVKRSSLVRKCCTGYLDYDGECLPYCMTGCLNGNCTSPNHCTCYDGYEEDEFNRCQPKCIGCKNGECLSPKVCQCKAGFDWNAQAIECKPRCSNDCANGICIEPNTCACNKGYVKHHSLDLCIPHCKKACVNGKCIAPNTCVCDTGYGAKNDSLNICEPICDIECKNGKCVEPNTCECHENYVVHDESRPHDCHCGKYCVEVDGNCHCVEERVKGYGRLYGDEPVGNCTKSSCENGFCATPDDCECLEGFAKDQDDTCTPQNDTCIDETIEDCESLNATTPEPSRSTVYCGCINGVCSHENKCFCIGGYKMSNKTADKCVPHCSKDCVNGYCNEPDLCECYEGYRNGINESDWNICYPVCNNDLEADGCVNGTCVAPNKCECFHGFEPSADANFTCELSEFDPNSYKMEASSSGLWIGSFVLIVILAAMSLFGFMTYKKRRQNYFYQDQYSTEPIANDASEDL